MTVAGGSGVETFLNLERVAGIARTASEAGLVLAFGAIGWPWLLKSLHGGGAEARARLLARTQLPEDALPQLGSWRADAGLLNLIADCILDARPDTVVEFGGGTTTLVAAQCLRLNGIGRLLSFDGVEEFAAQTREMLHAQGLEAEVRAAPLAPAPGGRPGQWYQHGPLPERIDLLIVDGPPWFLHPFGRGAADSLFDRISPGGCVILDDAARPGERIVARRWRRDWPDFDFRFVAGMAGTLIGIRRAGDIEGSARRA
ncbi:MAG: class I SAM-dependent methyltransferase [Candidatus Accumulibacter sp.]|nr:class I SAM-dependent methyltransferase [Accumulibacter sp.]